MKHIHNRLHQTASLRVNRMMRLGAAAAIRWKCQINYGYCIIIATNCEFILTVIACHVFDCPVYRHPVKTDNVTTVVYSLLYGPAGILHMEKRS
jgi:hypothetical protein